RRILTEALTMWLLVSLAVCFAAYVLRPSRGKLVLLCALLSYAVFTRLQLVYLLVLLVAVLWFRALRRDHLPHIQHPWGGRWPWGATLGAACVYTLVLLYIVAFWRVYGAFTLTKVSNVDLLGTVMGLHHIYGMPLEGADPRYAELSAKMAAFGGGAS